ncbi:hypothetical protein AVEN_185491-1 [Araneus ventricosus]|uniref:Uncharacterized protein n=1 Tax=Araneus ventricosus TaxID=182803 RepID=A0A4Y2H0W8_ARAVE|nr:hypothetical protein AVEN_185491-1 [Araneus ventricosus]
MKMFLGWNSCKLRDTNIVTHRKPRLMYSNLKPVPATMFPKRAWRTTSTGMKAVASGDDSFQDADEYAWIPRPSFRNGSIAIHSSVGLANRLLSHSKHPPFFQKTTRKSVFSASHGDPSLR